MLLNKPEISIIGLMEGSQIILMTSNRCISDSKLSRTSQSIIISNRTITAIKWVLSIKTKRGQLPASEESRTSLTTPWDKRTKSSVRQASREKMGDQAAPVV